MQPKIGVIGNGFVGNALVRGFMLDAEIRVYDKDRRRSNNTLEDTVLNSDYIFICLPTPMKKVEGGEIDLSIISSVIEEIHPMVANTRKILIIKSTVVPGTTKGFADKYQDTRFCFCPEFLTARQANLDFINSSRIIFGGPPDVTQELEEVVFKPRFPAGHFFRTDYTSAEMVKYMCNCFFAVKVLFCNEFYDIIQHFGLDYNEIKAMFLADGRIGNSHCNVNFGIDSRGVAGTCFPKDMNAIIHLCKDLGLHADILETAWKVNLRIRPREQWDWAENSSAVSNNKK